MRMAGNHDFVVKNTAFNGALTPTPPPCIERTCIGCIHRLTTCFIRDLASIKSNTKKCLCLYVYWSMCNPRMLSSRVLELEQGIEKCMLRHSHNDAKLKDLEKAIAELLLHTPDADLKQNILSFCMSQHPRLGMDSPATHLPSELAHMISVMVAIDWYIKPFW
jgi:hypothetical protein